MLGKAAGEADVQKRMDDNTIKYSDLEIGPLISSGSYGQVYHGKWKGAAVAVKVVKHSGLGTPSNERVSNEAMLAKHAIHPNIVPLFSKLTRKVSDPVSDPTLNLIQPSEQQSETLLVMEVCDKGSLNDRLQQLWDLRHRCRQTWLITVLACLLDLTYGMEYLHSNGICHGDLKPANIMCKASSRSRRGYICKICDFGLASAFDVVDNAYTSGKGDILYASPGRLCGSSVTQEDDIYSFGILVWHLMDGDSPQAQMPQLQLLHQLLNNNWRPDFSSEIPEEFKAMAESAWAINPADRPSFPQLRNILTELSKAYYVKFKNADQHQ